MPHLTAEDKSFFKDNGYLVKRDLLTRDQVDRAQDALWEGIEADREDPKTWVGAGPRSPVGGSHPDIRAALHDTPVFAMAEELVGVDTLNPGASPGPALVYPTGDDEWSLPDRGHLDGYYTPTNGVHEGTVGLFHVGATIYVDEVAHRGAAFTLWPGTHIQATEYFRARSGDDAVPLDCGDLPLEDLLSQLRRGGYRGDLVVELAEVTETDRSRAAEDARRQLAEILAGLSSEEAGRG